MLFVGSQAHRATLWLRAQLSRWPSSRIICCLEQNPLIKEAVWKAGHPEGLEPSTEKSGSHVSPIISPELLCFFPDPDLLLGSLSAFTACLGHFAHSQLYWLLHSKSQGKRSHRVLIPDPGQSEICEAQFTCNIGHPWAVQELGAYNGQ